MCKTKRGSKRRGKEGEKKKEGKREKKKLAGQQWRNRQRTDLWTWGEGRRG